MGEIFSTIIPHLVNQTLSLTFFPTSTRHYLYPFVTTYARLHYTRLHSTTLHYPIFLLTLPSIPDFFSLATPLTDSILHSQLDFLTDPTSTLSLYHLILRNHEPHHFIPLHQTLFFHSFFSNHIFSNTLTLFI